jgi:hypothetical protein
MFSCVTSGSGIPAVGFNIGNLEQEGERRLQAIKNYELEGANIEEISLLEPLVLAVGRVGALRRNSASEIGEKETYQTYLERMNSLGAVRKFSKTQFQDFRNIETRLTEVYVPLGFGIEMFPPSIVMLEQQSEINFATRFGALTFGERGDLVVAKYTLGLPSCGSTSTCWIIIKKLCGSGTAFADRENDRACAREYETGLFDARSGLEVSRVFEIKNEGKKIDPKTFKAID